MSGTTPQTIAHAGNATDALIAALVASKLALLDELQSTRARHRLERAMLLDRIDALARELEMTSDDRYIYRRRRDEQSPEAIRRRQEAAA